MDGAETMGEPDNNSYQNEIVSAVCRGYGYFPRELEEEFSYDQVVWLYLDACKHQQYQLALQTEWSYQAMIVAISSVLNKSLGGDAEIPEKLGLLDIVDNNGQLSEQSKQTLKYYNENAPDILDII